MLGHSKLAPTAGIIEKVVIHLSVYLGTKPGLNKIHVKEIIIIIGINLYRYYFSKVILSFDKFCQLHEECAFVPGSSEDAVCQQTYWPHQNRRKNNES